MGQPRTDRASRHSDRWQAARRQRHSQIDQDSHAPQPQISLGVWFRLFQRHSPLLLIITWAVLLGTAIAAVTAIVDPDVSVQSSSTSAKAGSSAELPQQFAAHSDHLPVQRLTRQAQKPRRSQTTQSGSPLSAGGALLISCAGGCLLLSRCLQPHAATRSRRRTVAKLASAAQPLRQPTAHQATQPSSTAEVAAELPAHRAAQSRWPIDSTIVLPQSALSSQSSPGSISGPSGVEAGPALPVSPVSILAADQSHPLDWNEPSLADSLDLRQKRPLSYWLRG